MKYQSHFGVYAAILNKDKTRMLLIKKRLGCYTGLYDLPGGTMEPHELLEETLLREVKEETDCHVTTATQMGMFSTLYPTKGYTLRHIGALYTAEITGTPRENGADADDNDDSDGCVWVALGDINDNNATPFVMDAVRALSP